MPVDPLSVRCAACLSAPGEPCIGTTSNLPRERPHRLRPLAAASRLAHCPSCEGSGWRDAGRMPIVGTVRCPVCGAAPHDRCTEGGRVRDELHEVRRRAARAGLEPCGECDAVGWVPGGNAALTEDERLALIDELPSGMNIWNDDDELDIFTGRDRRWWADALGHPAAHPSCCKTCGCATTCLVDAYHEALVSTVVRELNTLGALRVPLGR